MATMTITALPRSGAVSRAILAAHSSAPRTFATAPRRSPLLAARAAARAAAATRRPAPATGSPLLAQSHSSQSRLERPPSALSGSLAATLQRRSVFVISEATPNPESIVFFPQGKEVLPASRDKKHGKPKSKTFKAEDKHSIKSSLLASALFKVHGVHTVMLQEKKITVTKEKDAGWEFLKPNVELVMSQFFAAGLEVIDASVVEYVPADSGGKGGRS